MAFSTLCFVLLCSPNKDSMGIVNVQMKVVAQYKQSAIGVLCCLVIKREDNDGLYDLDKDREELGEEDTRFWQ
ncbi:hypothetical protein RO3G_03904 [Rhizopus delemar RA 99-880]|uniref:Uncharacterized protein n=1 Tax=Rhizopus delemar (strain RA 99-880 / ATCC MYA-4621 / FGSC 9543 / NRRL 43880) TaxID=246409 RepID=I1BSL9_RHIO9|nr:hypothetical protein RO3G_03904 [Rhizopus delemar RA 99-880]|eukprot:EIE79199.1 hypothetical protein RO3G_03904 [Rhizopus delemar RA 99-880]